MVWNESYTSLLMRDPMWGKKTASIHDGFPLDYLKQASFNPPKSIAELNLCLVPDPSCESGEKIIAKNISILWHPLAFLHL